MPLPFLPVSDDALFPALNGVVLGYLCLALLPRWRHTPAVTLLISTLYAAAYALLLANRALADPRPLPAGAGFGTLDGVARLFADRGALFAGWTHYISFDLFVARHVVLDSQARGIPHVCVVGVIPLVLFVGPAGFAVYMGVVVPLHAWLCGGAAAAAAAAAAATSKKVR